MQNGSRTDDSKLNSTRLRCSAVTLEIAQSIDRSREYRRVTKAQLILLDIYTYALRRNLEIEENTVHMLTSLRN